MPAGPLPSLLPAPAAVPPHQTPYNLPPLFPALDQPLSVALDLLLLHAQILQLQDDTQRSPEMTLV